MRTADKERFSNNPDEICLSTSIGDLVADDFSGIQRQPSADSSSRGNFTSIGSFQSLITSGLGFHIVWPCCPSSEP